MKDRAQIPLAIIGMACRLPGANGLENYWRLLSKGECSVREFPPERLDSDLYYDPKKGVRGKTYSKMGALVDYPPVDRTRYPLAEDLVSAADIGHLAICQVAADACRHARLDPFNLPLRNVGVYIGHTTGGDKGPRLIYATCIEQTAERLREIEGFRNAAGDQAETAIRELVQRIRARLPSPSGRESAMIASHMAAFIISKSFGLNGPSLVLDAACASSLQGLAIAGRALRLGRIDMAIIGGASYCNTDTMVLFSQAQSVSTVGSCPFDAEADGLIAGEGFVALVVKRLDRAVADGDPIHAVVAGLGIASDGRGKSLWAPRKEGQIEAIWRAYAGGIDIGRLQYIEAHATSTKLGDATEMAALAGALEGRIPEGKKVPIGSVKANLGHTLETAGVAGLIKVTLAMRHGMIPRQINIRQLSPQVDWDRVPFFVPTEDLEWPRHADGHPRRAAVNAFGIGGLNVHVVVDEYRAPAPVAVRAAVPEPAELREPRLDEGVAIIGRACIFPGARTLEAFWDLIVSGRDPKGEAPADRWDPARGWSPDEGSPQRPRTRRGGFVTDFAYDWRRHKVPPLQIARANPLQFMILDAAEAALHDAGYDRKPFDRKGVGVVVGTVFGDDFSADLQMGLRLPEIRQTLAEVLRGRGVSEEAIASIGAAFEEASLQKMPALLDDTGSFTPSTLASRITKTFDLMGGAMTVDAGNCSSLAALACAVDLLLNGACDMVLCAGGQRSMGPTTYAQFRDAGAADCVPGEGVGVLLLKRLSDARRDGDPIRGIIRGLGAAFGSSIEESNEIALRRALDDAQARPQEIVLVETQSSSLSQEAADEAACLSKVLCGADRPQPLAVGSSVPQMGHTLGASGMASALRATLELERRELPAAFGSEQSGPARAAQPGTPHAAREKTELVPGNPEGRLYADVASWTTLHGAYGAAGPAYHVVLERAEKAAVAAAVKPITAAPPQRIAWRIVRCGGGTGGELAEALRRLEADPAAAYASAEAGSFAPADRRRAAIVAEGPQDLAQKARLAAAAVDRADAAQALEAKDVFFGETAGAAAPVAFVFPGQGSQYAGMLQPLVEEFPPATEAARRIDAVLGGIGFPSVATVLWTEGDQLGTDVWRTQMGMLIADAIVFAALDAMGISPDRVTGHSFGEFPALLAAGAWTFEAAARATDARCKAIVACRQADGKMLVAAADADALQEACRAVGGAVYVANCNAPDQTVAGGDAESITRLSAWLKQRGIAAKEIRVPRPFHTPLMEEVQEPLARALAGIPIVPPRVPMLSSVTGRYVAEPDEIRANLVAQMTQPVPYVALVRRLQQEGVQAIVEIGPGQVLTRLNRRILAGRPAVLIAADSPPKAGLRGLLRVQACLETIGALEPAVRPAVQAFGAAGAPAPAERSTPAVPEPFAAEAAAAEAAGKPVLRLAGNRYEMGLLHGRALASQIRRTLRRHADRAWLAEGNANGEVPADPESLFAADELEEIRGIAEGAGVARAAVLAYNVRLRLHPDRPPAAEEPVRHVQVRSNAGGSPTAVHVLAGQVPADVAVVPSPPEPKPVPAAPVTHDPQALTGAAYAGALAAGIAASPGGTADRFCHRFVLRMVQSPVPAGAPQRPRFRGPALLIGENRLSIALGEEIQKCGGRAAVLPVSDDLDASLAALEQLWAQSPLPHLFLLTPYDEDAAIGLDETTWRGRRQRGVMVPYFLCQRWHQLASAAGLIHQASVVVATDLGGDFGVSGALRNAEGGALAGLVKGWRIEVHHRTKSDFTAKIVDRPPSQSLGAFAAAMLQELAIGGPEVEVAYEASGRSVARLLVEAAEVLPREDLPRGGTWVVTGGARGVTAVVALELGRRFGLKLHLVGSSPVPEIDPAWRDLSPAQARELRAALMKQSVARGEVPAEAWKRVEKAIEIDKNLRAFRQAGVQMTYHCCDVTDRRALAETLSRVRSQDGPIEGIVHGAGFERATRFDKKPRDVVEKTVATKVDGALALLELTQSDPLRYFVGFGSVSGRFGSLGQTDYCLANEMLSKVVGWHRRRHPACRGVTFHWHMWDEVGMATRPEASYVRDLPGCHLMPTREGAGHVVEELRAGVPESEVSVTEWSYCKLFFPMDEWLAEAPAAPAETAVQEPPKESPESVGAPEAAAPAAPAGLAQRYVLRVVESPLKGAGSTAEPPVAGPVVIVGDNADSQALRRQLERRGTPVSLIESARGAEAAIAELERLWATQPVPHMIVMTPRDPDAARIGDRQGWLRRRDAGILTPCLVCQRWLQLLAPSPQSGPATLTLITSLGGHFGWGGRAVAPESGALAGLFKSVRAEAQINHGSSLRVRILDAPADEPAPVLVASILREMAADADDAEVAFVGGKRRTVQLLAQPVEGLPLEDLPRGGTWVFVGGARGITAAVALELGKRYGLRLHLLGRTPPPELPDAWRDLSPEAEAELKRSLVRKALAEGRSPGEVWGRVQRDLEIDRNLRAMAAAGVKATYHACDVSDWDQTATTLDRIRAADGPIEGIVHGGGVINRAVQFGKKEPWEFSAGVGVKLDGAIALMALTRKDPLKYFIGFGSISGRFGSNAGTDYSMGNEGLAKLVDWFRYERPDCRTVCVHWHAWGDVGSMLDPRNYGTIQVMKVALMPAAEGVRHLVDELRAGAPESEVLIANMDNLMATMPSARASGVAVSRSLAVEPAAAPHRPAARRPLLDRVAEHVPGACVAAEVRLEPGADPFLVQHRFRTRPMMPLVIAMEAMAEAASVVADGAFQRPALRHIEIVNPLRFLSDEPQVVRVRAESTPEGIACRLTTDFHNRRGQLVQKDRPHFRALAEAGGSLGSAPALSLPPLQWHDTWYPEDDQIIFHGPAFRRLSHVTGGPDGSWYGKISAGATRDLAGRRPGDFLFPAAALDACFFACGIYVWYEIDQKLVSIPEGIDRVRVWRPARAGEACIVRLRLTAFERQKGSFDFELFGEDGTAILEVTGYRNINASKTTP